MPLGVAWLGEDGAGREVKGEGGGVMPTIDRLFREAGLGPEALREPGARIAVSIGPGGYTSVRVAVTAAKLLAEGTGAACVAVPSALVVARRVVHGAPFAVALASKRETAWITVFEARAGDGAPVRAMRAPLGLFDEGVVEVLRGAGVDLLVVDRFVPPEMRARAKGAGMLIAEPRFDPLACAELGMGIELGTTSDAGAADGTRAMLVDPLEMRPLYPREPEAVSKWRALHGGT